MQMAMGVVVRRLRVLCLAGVVAAMGVVLPVTAASAAPAEPAAPAVIDGLEHVEDPAVGAEVDHTQVSDAMDLPELVDLQVAADRFAEVASWWASPQVTAVAPVAVTIEADARREQLVANGVAVSALGWVHPLAQGRYASPFGARAPIAGIPGTGYHNGVDIAAPLGYPIRAAADGVVTYVGHGNARYGLSGWVVVIQHADGVETTYNHMAQSGILVKAGTAVLAGEIVAVVGNEGRSTGPHLHFTVHVSNKAVDPMTFMLSKGIDLRSGTTVTPVALTDEWLAAQAALRALALTVPAPQGPTLPQVPIPAANLEPTAPLASPEPSAPATPPTTPEPPATPTPSPTPDPTPSPTTDPSPSPTADPTETPSPTPTPEPTPTGTPTPDPTPTVTPESTPSPSASRMATPTPTPEPPPEAEPAP